MTKSVEAYLRENIDEQIVITPWHEMNNFPIFLKNSYVYYGMSVLGTQCILMEVIEAMSKISQIKKQVEQVKKLTNRQPVLYYKVISQYRRKSLINNRIAFVIDDGQMYLPFLNLDIKKAPENVKEKAKKFSTPAQIAFLYLLYHKEGILSPTIFAEMMEFSIMTASRALNELYQANLVTYETGGKTGRSKQYKRITDPDYFRNGQKYLKTPVRKTIYTKTVPDETLTAGLMALASLSMINPPENTVLAIDKKQINNEQIEVINNNDFIKDSDQFVELQLWDYDPKLFSDKKHVDIVSLYASLKDDPDERIEQALEDILRGKSWYTV